LDGIELKRLVELEAEEDEDEDEELTHWCDVYEERWPFAPVRDGPQSTFN
jgi:hypothetical protein